MGNSKRTLFGCGDSKHLWDFLFGKFPSSHFAILQVQFTPAVSLLPFKLPLRLSLVHALIAEVTCLMRKVPGFCTVPRGRHGQRREVKPLFYSDCSLLAFPHLAEGKPALGLTPAAQLAPHHFQDKQEVALPTAFDSQRCCWWKQALRRFFPSK